LVQDTQIVHGCRDVHMVASPALFIDMESAQIQRFGVNKLTLCHVHLCQLRHRLSHTEVVPTEPLALGHRSGEVAFRRCIVPERRSLLPGGHRGFPTGFLSASRGKAHEDGEPPQVKYCPCLRSHHVTDMALESAQGRAYYTPLVHVRQHPGDSTMS